MAGPGVSAVEDFGRFLEGMLEKARDVKKSDTIEPPLNKSDLLESFEHVNSIFPSTMSLESRKHSIDAAARDVFNNLLATTTIDKPSFVNLWNLLDIVSILCDDEQAEPGLLFWLVEELLDSQTVAGCRRIFDYLESRRERITAKHFAPKSPKSLVVLRSCNELLRRLSRAEDTAFCGRVFIFLFQSFPLGDKSSVNLRGEFHTENITTFDVLPPTTIDPEVMELDSNVNSQQSSTSKETPNGTIKRVVEELGNSKGVSFSKTETPMSTDRLYPIFWSLQQSFSQPKKLFDPVNFSTFKAGLEATIILFRSVQTESSMRPTKVVDESKRGVKRKRGQGDDDLANAFNPKYLTSRDLFELEISDLSFRRHILVQVLIVLDFLLSLSAKAKEKLSKASLENPNKSVMYADQVLSETDAQWAQDMKKTIADYLRQGLDGAFFYRMVETVLSRDKNWARWKIENCPSIAKPPVSSDEYSTAKASARRATTNKRLRPNPMGSLDLNFLSDLDNRASLDRLKDPSRYELPPVKSYQSKIELDDMDIEMANDGEAKNAAVEAKASKSWRALRVATGSKLVAFDKIESSEKIGDIFKEQTKSETVVDPDYELKDSEDAIIPKDNRSIVLSGPSGAGKGTLIKMLMDKHGKVLGKKASHTTRQPRDGEVNGEHYYFITREQYDILRDGDKFLEINNYNGNDYGTSREIIDGIVAQGKVPLMEMDMHGIQQLKDQEFPARFIFIAPPDLSELERRIKQRGSMTDEMIQQRIEIAKEEIKRSQLPGFHDKIVVNGDLDTTFIELESYIFGINSDVDQSQPEDLKDEAEAPVAVNTELEMANGATSSEDVLKDGIFSEVKDTVKGKETEKIAIADLATE